MKKALLLIVCLAFVSVAIAEEQPVNLLKSCNAIAGKLARDAYYFNIKTAGVIGQGLFYGAAGGIYLREWIPTFPTDEADYKWMLRVEGRLTWAL